MTCKLNADTSDGLKIVSDTSGEIDLQIDASTKVHMASDGKVGIGTTSPAHMLHVKASDSRVRTEESSGSTTFDMTNTSSGHFLDSSGANNLTINKSGAGALTLKTSNAERTRIDANGRLCHGTSDPASGGSSGDHLMIIDTNSSYQNGIVYVLHGNNNAGTFFTSDSTYAGAIACSGNETTFTSASDYRLKENVNYTFDATARLKQLKPARFNWIADDTNRLVDGFLAHEVSSIVPEAVTETKDATKDLGTIKDADNNVIYENVLESLKEDGQTWEKTSTENVYQGIDQSKLVPLLVKTIQELEARITALES
jgi:hypothetical protein